MSDQFDLQPIRIKERENLVIKARKWSHDIDTTAGEVLSPIIQCSLRNRAGDSDWLSCASTPPRRTRPGKEGEDAARTPQLITVVEVIDTRIVEVDGQLDQSQAQQAGIEID